MRKIIRTVAIEEGYIIDNCCYPPIAYKGERIRPDADAFETYTELETELINALQAIKARIDGRFDHPALVAFGPLLPSRSSDCYLIAEQALAQAGVQS